MYMNTETCGRETIYMTYIIYLFMAPFCHHFALQFDPRLQHGWWSGRGPQAAPWFPLFLHNQNDQNDRHCKGPDIPGTSAMGGLTLVTSLSRTAGCTHQKKTSCAGPVSRPGHVRGHVRVGRSVIVIILLLLLERVQ